MQPNNFLAKFLIKKQLITGVTKANLVSMVILSAVIIISIFLSLANIFSSNSVNTERFNNPDRILDGDN